VITSRTRTGATWTGRHRAQFSGAIFTAAKPRPAVTAWIRATSAPTVFSLNGAPTPERMSGAAPRWNRRVPVISRLRARIVVRDHGKAMVSTPLPCSAGNRRGGCNIRVRGNTLRCELRVLQDVFVNGMLAGDRHQLVRSRAVNESP